MMMRMLDAGGVALLTDGLRQADEDNPTGYYELDAVKRLGKEEPTWLDEAAGGAVKIISRLLYELPSDRSYRVLFMHRDLDDKTMVRPTREFLEQDKMAPRTDREELHDSLNQGNNYNM